MFDLNRIFYVSALSVLLLSGCGSSNSNEAAIEPPQTVKAEVKEKESKDITFTLKEYEGRIVQALEEMGDKTNLKFISSELQDDGKTVITLSENVMLFVTTNKKDVVEHIGLGVMPEVFFTHKDDFYFSFLLLIGTADASLSMGDRNLILRELGIDNEENLSEVHSKTHRNNNVVYKYRGTIKENFILQAELK